MSQMMGHQMNTGGDVEGPKHDYIISELFKMIVILVSVQAGCKQFLFTTVLVIQQHWDFQAS